MQFNIIRKMENPLKTLDQIKCNSTSYKKNHLNSESEYLQ